MKDSVRNQCNLYVVWVNFFILIVILIMRKVISIMFEIKTDEILAEQAILKEFNPSLRGSSVQKWLLWMTEENKARSSVFPCIFSVLLQKFTTIPVTSCSCKRSFSKMAQVKNKLRSTMRQDRLDALLLLYIEQDSPVHVDVESVIDYFKNMTGSTRRMRL